MKAIAVTNEGHIISLELPTERVRQLAQENHAEAGDVVVIISNGKTVTPYLNAEQLPFISAVDLAASVDTVTPALIIRALSPSFVANNKKLSPRARSTAPRYADLIRRLQAMANVNVMLVDPSAVSTPAEETPNEAAKEP